MFWYLEAIEMPERVHGLFGKAGSFYCLLYEILNLQNLGVSGQWMAVNGSEFVRGLGEIS